MTGQKKTLTVDEFIQKWEADWSSEAKKLMRADLEEMLEQAGENVLINKRIDERNKIMTNYGV